MSIRVKLALAFGGLAVLGLLVSLVGSFQAVRGAALDRLRDAVELAVDDFQQEIEQRREEERRQIDLVLSQPAYTDALSKGRNQDAELGLTRGSPEKLAQEQSQALTDAHELFLSASFAGIKQRAADAPATAGAAPPLLLVLVNGYGEVIYNESTETFGERLTGLRILDEALAGGTAADLWSAAYAKSIKPGLLPAAASDLYLVLAQPVLRGEEIVGAVLVGRPVEHLLSGIERDLGGAKVILQARDGAVASQLKDVAAVTAGGLEQTEVALAGVKYFVRSRDILQRDHPGARLGRVFVLVGFEKELEKSLAVFWKWMLPLAALTLVFAGGATHVLSRWLADPLLALAAAAHKVGQGDLTVEVKAYGRDEVARLASAFNEMVSGLRQRDQIKGLFKRYLNPAVVDELIKHPEKASPGGERRHITVLFSDLVGFTSLSENMSPEDLVGLLNEYFEQASQALALHGATLDKFIGDAIMCFWNAPLPQEDHAARACRAAVDLMAVVDRLRPQFAARGVASFECRIGMNTGPCIVGNIGSANAQDYTVIGDTVNLASRLESAAKVYGTRTLVAYETAERGAGAVLTRELDLVRVKGKAQPVRVYELLGPASMARPAHLEAFARGLSLYRERRFEEAQAAFASIAEVDPPARLFRERCARLLADPPGPDWDGVYSLDSK